MRGVVSDELLKVKAAYGDRRRTQIVNLKKSGKAAKSLVATDLITEQTVWIGVTADGMVSRTHEDKAPRPRAMKRRTPGARPHPTDTLYLVAKSGKAAAIALHTLPEAEKLIERHSISKLSPLTEER